MKKIFQEEEDIIRKGDKQQICTKLKLQIIIQYFVRIFSNQINTNIRIFKNKHQNIKVNQKANCSLSNSQNNSRSKHQVQVVFSNQGNLIAIGSGKSQNIILIDISDLEKDDIIYQLFQQSVNAIIFSNDTKYLISGSQDEKVKIWDVESKKEAFQLDSQSQVLGVAISYDNTLIASCTFDCKIRIWNFQNQRLLCRNPIIFGCGIQFFNDQKMLVSSDCDGNIKFWGLSEIHKGKLFLIRVLNASTDFIVIRQFSSRLIIAICFKTAEIKMIDSLTGNVDKLYKLQKGKKNSISDVAISRDMDILAYAEGNDIVIWRRK